MSPAPPLSPEHLRQVSALLEQALAMPDAERGAWLGTLPAEAQSFVPLLSAMLARDGVETDGFMRGPIGLGLGDLASLDAPPDAPGDSVGPYRLLRELGHGGMATVWLAERADGVLHRQVALKLPHEGWAVGLAQRMARERDILAALEHPNIARLYDAGIAEGGRPWMAMEWVDGRPIDAYARERGLAVDERLRLFLQVAEAVSHAHARLVVHRDLKPANILVGEAGDVHLLDFGVAKLLGGEGAGAAQLTQLIGRAVTPDYASPEQLAGRPVTVATDVYSLGVVLYELLTGQRPYHLGTRGATPLDEALASIEVPAASTRVLGERTLARRLRGDLDTVLAKALHKDAAQRYASVESLAADVRRHLEGEPVLAQRPTRTYRLSKFVRRHRVGFGAAASIAAALLLGLGAAAWQAREARIAAARAEQVKEFIASIFRQATPREGVGGTVSASDLLAAAARRIEQELANDPRAAAELGVIVGQGFFSLGEARLGESALRAAIVRAQREFGPRHPITLQGKALLVEAIDDIDAAERLLAEAVPDALSALPASAEAAVFALRSQSWVMMLRGRREESLAASRRAVEIGEQYLGARHRDTIRALGLQSQIFGRFGLREAQLRSASEALTRARAEFGTHRPHPVLTGVERWYGNALTANDRPAEAVPVFETVLREQRLLDPKPTERLLLAMTGLAAAQAGAGRIGEALPVMRAVVESSASREARDPLVHLGHGEMLLGLLIEARRVDEAAELQARLAALLPTPAEPPTADDVEVELRRSRVSALQGDAAGALEAAQAAERRAGSAFPALRAQAWLVAAASRRWQGRADEALAYAQRVALDDTTLPLIVRASAATEAGRAALALGDTVRAAQAFDRARSAFAGAQVEPGVRTSDLLVGEAQLLLREQRGGEAQALLQPLVRAWEGANPGSPWHGEALYWLARAQGTANAAAQRAAALAMLRASKLPALERLAADPRS